ncbi:MAG: C2 family cysteine protease [Gemmataceae bacterium]
MRILPEFYDDYLVDQPEPDRLIITDDEDNSDFWIESVQDAREGGPIGSITLRRADPTDGLSMPYFLDPTSSATMGVDFAPLSGHLTFAPGQATAVIFVDASGPYNDFVPEDDETVVLTFLPPPAANPMPPKVAPPVVIRELRAGNWDPTFTLPAGKPRFEFHVGDLAPEKTYVDQVIAVDPDGDEIKFTITAGNAGNVFSIDPKTGKIALAKTLTATMPGSYDLTVKAEDGRGGSATATVRIEVRPLVVLSGDRHGVEASVGGGKRDNIELVFRRLTRDAGNALTVNYTVTFDPAEPGATRADLANPNDLIAAGAAQGSLTFAAGQVEKKIILRLTEDNVAEDLERFDVSLVIPADRSYVSVPDGVDWLTLGHVQPGLKGERTAELYLLDAVQLFVGTNAKAEFADPAGKTVDINDIRQGALPNCWLMAGVGAIALKTPDAITNGPNAIIKDLGTGQAAVRFFSAGRWRTINVDMTLDFGVEGPKLSTDSVVVGNTRKFEIWTAVLEKAYGKFIGRPALAATGNSHKVWWALLNEGAQGGPIARTVALDPDFATTIKNKFNAGKKVVFGTPENFVDPAPKGNGGARIIANHAYVLKAIVGDIATFYNPWGKEHFTITFNNAELQRCFGGGFVYIGLKGV